MSTPLRDKLTEDLQFIVDAIGPAPRPEPLNYLGSQAVKFAEQADIYRIPWAAECLAAIRKHVVEYAEHWRKVVPLKGGQHA